MPVTPCDDTVTSLHPFEVRETSRLTDQTREDLGTLCACFNNTPKSLIETAVRRYMRLVVPVDSEGDVVATCLTVEQFQSLHKLDNIHYGMVRKAARENGGYFIGGHVWYLKETYWQRLNKD